MGANARKRHGPVERKRIEPQGYVMTMAEQKAFRKKAKLVAAEMNRRRFGGASTTSG